MFSFNLRFFGVVNLYKCAARSSRPCLGIDGNRVYIRIGQVLQIMHFNGRHPIQVKNKFCRTQSISPN